MEIADFSPRSYAYELRYAKNYLLWDSAGRLTERLMRELPNVQVAEGTPARVALHSGSNVSLIFEHNKAAVVVYRPKRGGDELHALAKTLTHLVVDLLKVSSFSRVGSRMIYQQSFPTVEAATETLLGSPCFRGDAEAGVRFFNQQGKPKQVESVSRWENDTTGVRVRLSTETEKFDFSLPPQHQHLLEPISRSTHYAVVDVDIYTTATITIEQLKPEDWIKNALHMVSRDMKHFLRR